MNPVLFILIFFVILVAGIGSIQTASAQGVQTAGGVNVDGTWYAGEGLKKSDYFHYRLCQIDLNDCATFDMKFWVRGDVQKGTETLWDYEVVVIDGSKIVKGYMQIGKTAPEPVGESDDLFYYSLAYKSSIAWLSAFATSNEGDRIHGPQGFREAAWGKVAAIGGAQLIPLRAETIEVRAGVFDTVVVGWYSGQNNEIWLLDDFPFPVKAKVWAWVTTGIPPIQYEFELLEYRENVSSSPFVGIVSTVDPKKTLGCPTDYDVVKATKNTDTSSMIVEYLYGPKYPMPGCDIEWKINFKNKYNPVEFVDQVHYDIAVLDDEGFQIRSIAQEEGRSDLFNGFGQLHKFITVKESAGTAHYVIVVIGKAPKDIVPLPEFSGIVKVDIEIRDQKQAGVPSAGTLNIPPWIKNNAGWWSSGQIGDSDFVSGIQYLINKGIMKIPVTTPGSGSGSNEIPNWIKNNAGWWADGLISDQDFVSGIQYLITNNILKIT